MNYKIDHDFHIHTKLSFCSKDPNQNTKTLLSYAKKNGMSALCVTDHFWSEDVKGASDWYEPQNLAHISQILPLPKDDEVRFMFGCETELTKNGVLGISKANFDKFDFVIIPTTHFHMEGFTMSSEQLESPKTRAKAWTNRLYQVLDMDLPFHKIGFAHLTCHLIYRNETENLLETFNLISRDEMARIFTKVAKLGAGIELNAGDMKNAQAHPDLFKPYIVAKECGCKFYLGSDAHHPDKFDMSPDAFAYGVKCLELDESDKFILTL